MLYVGGQLNLPTKSVSVNNEWIRLNVSQIVPLMGASVIPSQMLAFAHMAVPFPLYKPSVIFKNKCLRCALVVGDIRVLLLFVDTAMNCVYWQFSEVFLSPCSNILYVIMLGFFCCAVWGIKDHGHSMLVFPPHVQRSLQSQWIFNEILYVFVIALKNCL